MRDMGYRSDSIAISCDMGPLRKCNLGRLHGISSILFPSTWLGMPLLSEVVAKGPRRAGHGIPSNTKGVSDVRQQLQAGPTLLPRAPTPPNPSPEAQT